MNSSELRTQPQNLCLVYLLINPAIAKVSMFKYFFFLFRPSQSCTSPPLTPKSHRSRQTNARVSCETTDENFRQMQNYETIPCNCDNKASSNSNSCAGMESKTYPKSYENYDIPRNLCKQVSVLNFISLRRIYVDVVICLGHLMEE